MSPDHQLLWAAYEAAERRGIRAASLEELKKFVDAFASATDFEKQEFVAEQCTLVTSRADAPPIREPLFERIFLPVLVEAFRDRRPNAAWWLAHFALRIAGQPRYAKHFDVATEDWFLRAALEHDSNDRRARNRLVRIREEGFRNALHELPAGVLDGHNGADANGCEELLEDLVAFEKLASPVTPQQLVFIGFCREHFLGYKDYLENRGKYPGYQAYMQQHGLKRAVP
jgi:hypothetical protein